VPYKLLMQCLCCQIDQPQINANVSSTTHFYSKKKIFRACTGTDPTPDYSYSSVRIKHQALVRRLRTNLLRNTKSNLLQNTNSLTHCNTSSFFTRFAQLIFSFTKSICSYGVFSFAFKRLISSEKVISERTLTNALFMFTKSRGV
jgi:hypothetical protein